MAHNQSPQAVKSTALFNLADFHEGVLETDDDIAFIRKYLCESQSHINDYFTAGGDVSTAIRKRAWLVDQVLAYLWCQASLSPSDNIALLAVGGYGRAELHPHSDVDILLLLRDNEDESFNEGLERFLTKLWDIGLQIGHSVRSLDECLESARNDLCIVTSLLEARVIHGPQCLLAELNEVIAPQKIWGEEQFFQEKLREQQQRHAKHNNTEYNLEPDIKNAPGGLRDIQTIGWVAKRHFDANNFAELADKGFISEKEHRTLDACQTLLWELRYHLHLMTNRGENRLLFDYQHKLSSTLGYEDNESNLAIEQLMKQYYRTALAVSQLNELLLQLFNELILEDQSNSSITAINKHFQLRNDAIEATHPLVFEENPSALLDIFKVIANRKDIKTVRASTIRLIMDNVHLIDDVFRNNPQNNRIFMAFLRSPYNIFSQLKRMKRYGVLGRYLPAFDKIVGQSQFDLFHIYTVDAHTLLVIRNMRCFRLSEQRKPFPIAHHISQQLPKIELLYLAGLFHDIGKGRGGDHSILGATDSTKFCIRHGLSRSDTQLLAWLVQNHLLMSMTAQKKDLSDPDVIQSFAEKIDNELKLDYLYALTVADICATNPELWTSWRASLMRELYRKTKHVFRRGLGNPVDDGQRIADNRSEALARMSQASKDGATEEIKAIWDSLSDDYFLRESPSDIAWHTDGIIQHTSNKPLILIRETSSRKFEGGTQIFIYMEDRANLFAMMVSTMEQLHLSVVDARIITSSSNFSLDTYIVLDEDGSPIGSDCYRNELIHKTLETALENTSALPELVRHRLPRQLKNFAPNTHIRLHDSKKNHHSILEVNTLDRPGVLAEIGLILAQMDIAVLNARITTLGERADDIFFVVDQDGDPFEEKAISAALKEKLCQSLDQIDGHSL